MRLCLPDYVQLTEIKGKLVLLDCQKNLFYGVSKSGAEFLQQIKHHGDMDKATKTISSLYNISNDQVRNDMYVFLDYLIQKGLIVKI
ncbi:PqqD family protein [Shimazuella alba]|uniref:PqqD family peptide modification chaperone n=1 Tax=Shimazuella alba TaxID=2690964 RepID=A0A6I4VZA4_9BACL|nr:PqqD family protein [Shimazuella alba]MXQ55280.1 PqqD family peptide modification chaperone [Shimazuella alba]